MAKTILLVEDDEDIATLLRLNLQDEGYQIVHEADGDQALVQLEKQVWDAVILDLMRPGDLPAYPSDDPLPASNYHQRSHQRNAPRAGPGDGRR